MKRVWLLLIPVLAMVLFAGCKKDASESKYGIYYLNTEDTSLVYQAYEPKATSTSGQIKEYINALSEDTKSVDYMKTIPAKVKVEDFQLSDGTLSLYFNSEYAEMGNYQEVLVRAAITKTLLQVENVKNVAFYVEDKPLTDSLGNVVGNMTADSFIEDFGEETDSLLQTELVLYFSSADGQSLVKEKKKVYYSSNIPLEKLVMEYLLKGPDNSKEKSAIPENTKILGVSVTDGICYVNLNATFQNKISDVAEQVTIYSIVDSLTELDSINKVQILVNGETSGTFFEQYSLDTVYERNTDLLTENITPNAAPVLDDSPENEIQEEVDGET